MGVPAFFPLVRAGCEEAAAQYFACLEKALKEKSEAEACNKDEYEKCTKKSLKDGAKTVILTEYQK
jgi:hypothetical protein